MKLNIAFNILLLLLVTLALGNLYGYVVTIVLIIINLMNSKTIHSLWVVSCIQTLILIPITPILGLLLIAIANVIYYVNLNIAKRYQNDVLSMIINKIFVVVMIQAIIVASLVFISREVRLYLEVSFSIISLMIIAGIFWVLLVKRQHD